MEEQLKFRAKRIRGQMHYLQTTIEARLEHFGFSKVKELKNRANNLAEEIQKSHTKLKKLKSKEAAAQVAFSVGQNTENKFIEAEKHANDLKALEEKGDDIERERTRLDRAKNAKGLSDVHSRYEDDKKKATAAESVKDQTAEQLSAAVSEHEESKANLKEAEKSEPDIEKLKADIVKLGELENKVDGLNKSRESYEASKSVVEESEQRLEQQQAELTQAIEEKNSLQTRLDEISPELIDEKLLALQVQRSEEEIRFRTSVVEADREQQKLQSQLGEVKTHLQQKSA
jgi:hypothetical protein